MNKYTTFVLWCALYRPLNEKMRGAAKQEQNIPENMFLWQLRGNDDPDQRFNLNS